jgi:hypothetical protein
MQHIFGGPDAETEKIAEVGVVEQKTDDTPTAEVTQETQELS